MSDNTTITVSKEFRNAIHDKKGPGESYEQILREYLPGELMKVEE